MQHTTTHWRRAAALVAGALISLAAVVFAVTPANASVTVGCTTFYQTNQPNGAAMTQSYTNCNSTNVGVVPYYWQNFAYHFYAASRVGGVAPGQTIQWSYSSTASNSAYGTAFYDVDAHQPVWQYASAVGANCNTYTAGSVHTYGNCGSGPQYVGIAYVNASGAFHLYPNSCHTVEAGTLGHWNVPTPRYSGATYTTVFCSP